MNDELFIFIKHKGDLKEFNVLANQVKNEIVKELRLPIKYVLPCKRIYKTTSGKVKRYKFVEDYLNGDYKEIINSIEDLNLNENVEMTDYNTDEIDKMVMELLHLIQVTLGPVKSNQRILFLITKELLCQKMQTLLHIDFFFIFSPFHSKYMYSIQYFIKVILSTDLVNVKYNIIHFSE
jgi:hypothetical protein